MPDRSQRTALPAGSWPAPRRRVNEGTNSFLYMPLLLDASGFLAQEDVNTWTGHALSRAWWQDTIAVLQALPEVPADAIREGLEQVASHSAREEESLQVFLRRISQRSVSLTEIMHVLLPENGHLPNLVQDVVLQIYAGVSLSRELDARADGFRTHMPQTHANPTPRVISRHALRPHRMQDAAQEMRQAGIGEPMLGGPSSLPRSPSVQSFVSCSDMEDDASSVDGMSEFGGPEEQQEEDPLENQEFEALDFPEMSQSNLHRAFESLDAVDLEAHFRNKVHVMQAVPAFARGLFRNCQRAALKYLHQHRLGESTVRARAWKLLLLLFRMLLLRNPGQKLVPREDLAERFRTFWQAAWLELTTTVQGTIPSCAFTPYRLSAERQRALRAERAVPSFILGKNPLPGRL